MNSSANEYEPEDEFEPEAREVSPGKVAEDGWETLEQNLFAMDDRMTAAYSNIDHDEVVLREFIPVALALLMRDKQENVYVAKSDSEIVKSCLLATLKLSKGGIFGPIITVDYDTQSLQSELESDVPVDTGLWWIILVHFYVNKTMDYKLLKSSGVQAGIRNVLKNCLYGGFTNVPTLLCPDGCSMMETKMGIHGYPIEIQALFFFAMKCAEKLLIRKRPNDDLVELLCKRISNLEEYIRRKYWRDGLTDNTDIPDCVSLSFGDDGGYFIGNMTRTDIDFRWFVVGNFIAILSNLATDQQAKQILSFVQSNWDKLIGEAPLRLVYPAVSQVGNKEWSCFNGGSWPGLMWLFTSACVKVKQPQLASRAVEILEKRLYQDRWPQYYNGEVVLEPAVEHKFLYRTSTCASFLLSKMLLENNELQEIIETGQITYMTEEPTDLFLISDCLLRKVYGKPLMRFEELDIYSNHPEDLFRQRKWHFVGKSVELFFYTSRGERAIRKFHLQDGSACCWKEGRKGGEITDPNQNNETVGAKRLFSFYVNNKSTGWKMVEYSVEASNIALCKLTKKDLG